MILWLKQRLGIWVGASLLGASLLGDVGASHAQNRTDDSPEEVSKQFIGILTTIGVAHRRYHSDIYLHFGKSGLVSQKSARDEYAALVFENLAAQIYLPQFTARLSTSDEKSAKVRVEPDKTAPPHEIVLIREQGAWKVDLMATYANWNRITEAQARQQYANFSNSAIGASSSQNPRSSCQSNLKVLALDIAAYAADHNERFPPAKSWMSALRPYLRGEEIFNCPSLSETQKYGYAYNSKFSLKFVDPFEKSSKSILIYETTILKPNAYGSGENLAFRHQNGANYAFADGHVKWFPKTQTPSFKLKP